MKKLTLIIAALFVVSCSTIPSPETAPNEPSSNEPALPSPSPAPFSATSLKAVTDLAAASKCAAYKWAWGSKGDTGLMPKAYFRGVALTYARAVCNPNRTDLVVTGQALGDASKDGLVHLSAKFKAAGVSLATKADRVRGTFMLGMGSAMRESSGRWCVGKDPGASNDDAETCEAGLHQTSYNSRHASPELPKLFALYKTDKSGCFFETYSAGVTCSAANLKNYGTGEGVVFQELSKKCPGFAVDYANVMFRVRRSHYGPINTQKTEIVKVCSDLLLSIEKLINENPQLCKDL